MALVSKLSWRLSRLKCVCRPAACAYSKFTVSRQPAKVLSNKDLDNKQKSFRARKGAYEPWKRPGEGNKQLPLDDVTPGLESVAASSVQYEKVGPDDTLLSRFAMDSSSKAKREKKKIFMLEGKRLVSEALQANLKLQALFFSRFKDVETLQLPKNKFIFQKLNYKVLERWSRLTTSPGIIGFFKLPTLREDESDPVLPLTLICDNIRTPDNLGVIIRVAAGVGCRRIILTKGCVDLWDSKVLRAAAGSHFHVPIVEGISWADVPNYIGKRSHVFFADNNITEESDGLRKEADLQESQCETETDSDDESQLERRDSPSDSGSAERFDLPVTPYFSLNFSEFSDIVLIVGGETEGISSQALRVGDSYNGLRLNIPMANCVESLNVGTALGIIVYEMRRQFASIDSLEEESLGVAPVSSL